MIGTNLRPIGSTFVMLAVASGLIVIAPAKSDAAPLTSDAEVSAQRRSSQRHVVPRARGRRQADRASEQAMAPRVYVPGHFAWDLRRGQYSWVAGRWERYDPKHAFVGAGWQFRNGQWTFGPTR
jgi:hypothetical protein